MIALPASTFFYLGQSGVLSFLLTSVLNPFLAFHTYLLFNNMTTLEFCEQHYGKRKESKTESDEGSDSKGEDKVGETGEDSKGLAVVAGTAAAPLALMSKCADGDGGSNAAAATRNVYDMGLFHNIAQVMGTRNV